MKKLILYSSILLALSIFAAKNADVRDYGAKPDGVTLNTEAIQRGIDDISKSGGGRLTFTGGAYLTGTIILKDGVELHLEQDSSILGSKDYKDWVDQPKSDNINPEMAPRFRTAALIFADGAKNISITGRGAIDANGTNFVEKIPGDKIGVQYRRILDTSKSPPRVLLLAGCSDIRIKDITLRNLPAGWGFWVHNCDRAFFDGVNILADVDYPNNDGIHVNSSRDVMISNCKIECGDDCIVVRANSAMLKTPRPSERVNVVNCSLRTYANGIRIGWLNDGVIRNCTFSNINISDSANGIGIVLPNWAPRKDMPDQGVEATLIENLTFDNFVMDRIYARPIDCEIATNPNTRCAAFRNIKFSNMFIRSLEYPRFIGRKANFLENITLSNCSFEKIPDTTPGLLDWRKLGFTYGLRRRGSHPETKCVKNLIYDNVNFTEK